MLQLGQYRKLLKQRLTPERYRHSLCVMRRAAQLASIHGADWYRAALSGLLHDICQCMPKDEQLKYLKAHGILLDSFSTANPSIWHAICAEVYLREKIGIQDTAVLSAVRWHTTGKAAMSLLDQVVYLADATSDDRDYPGVDELRMLSEENLPVAMFRSLQHTVTDVVRRGQPLVGDGWEAYNYFWGICLEYNTAGGCEEGINGGQL